MTHKFSQMRAFCSQSFQGHKNGHTHDSCVVSQATAKCCWSDVSLSVHNNHSRLGAATMKYAKRYPLTAVQRPLERANISGMFSDSLYVCNARCTQTNWCESRAEYDGTEHRGGEGENNRFNTKTAMSFNKHDATNTYISYFNTQCVDISATRR